MPNSTTPKISTVAALRKAEAQEKARLHNVPHCPLKVDAVIEFQGTQYAVIWHSYDGLSKTMKMYVDVFSYSTGERCTFDQIIFSIKRDKQGNGKVRYNLRGHKGWGSREEAQQVLVALAAEKLRGITNEAPLVITKLEDFDFKTNGVELFWSKVAKTDTCWLWEGYSYVGYGRVNVTVKGEKTIRRAHQVAFVLMGGELIQDMELDHLCKNPLCVNPAHLEQVTPQENRRRSNSIAKANAAKTHCPKGHPYSGENLQVEDCSGTRRCQICRRAGKKAAWQKYLATRVTGPVQIPVRTGGAA